MTNTIFDRISEPLPTRVTAGLARIGIALRSQAWKEGEALGLTPTQGEIVALLHARADDAMRLSAVADALAITRATASDAVSALVRKGLVAKERAADDGRAVALRLTADGARDAKAIVRWPAFLQRAVGGLSGAEQTVVLKALITIIGDLQENGRIPIARMCLTCRFFLPNAHDDADKPHHCAFVDAPFGTSHLRIDCADHVPAPADAQRANRAVLSALSCDFPST